MILNVTTMHYNAVALQVKNAQQISQSHTIHLYFVSCGFLLYISSSCVLIERRIIESALCNFAGSLRAHAATELHRSRSIEKVFLPASPRCRKWALRGLSSFPSVFRLNCRNFIS